VANALVAQYPECAFASMDAREAGLGHRLDKETSGALIAARHQAAWRGLRRALGDPSCEKTYLAEVKGHPPDQGKISAEIGRTGRRGGRVKVGGGRHPLPASTAWEVVSRLAGSSLLRARIHAGRAHQVRAHLAAAGYPIVGDPLYPAAQGGAGADHGASAVGANLRLHAESVRLVHPISGAQLLIEAPPPAWGAAPRR
jgi:23S rRNA pseudouridine1911/1915/1917 synthase